MGKSCSHDHTKNEYGGISVALSGHEKLPTRTTASESEGKAGHQYPGEVPETLGVGHWLICKTGFKLSHSKISKPRCCKKSDKTEKKVKVPEQDQVSQSSHCTEPATLSDEPHHKAYKDRNHKRSVLRPRTFDTIEKYPTFRFIRYLRINQGKYQQTTHD